MRGFPGRKDNIILAAIEIISEEGIQGLSTKRIAARQGISESILYKHFKSIDDVLVTVVRSFSRFDEMIMRTVQKKDICSRGKILYYIKLIVELYENYPALASIVLNYEPLMHCSHTRQIVMDITGNRKSFIKEVIEIGQSLGELNYYYTSQELTDIVGGIFKNTIFRWKLSGYDFSLKETMLVTIKKVLDKA